MFIGRLNSLSAAIVGLILGVLFVLATAGPAAAQVQTISADTGGVFEFTYDAPVALAPGTAVERAGLDTSADEERRAATRAAGSSGDTYYSGRSFVAPRTTLSEASAAAFRAADDPASIFIKNKHLATAGGNHAKFASTDIGEVQGWVAQGLRSDGVQFLPNQLDGTFRAIVPAGQVVGTKGQTSIRVIVTNDGRVINAFPVNTR